VVALGTLGDRFVYMTPRGVARALRAREHTFKAICDLFDADIWPEDIERWRRWHWIKFGRRSRALACIGWDRRAAAAELMALCLVAGVIDGPDLEAVNAALRRARAAPCSATTR
jgi:hypothetical protein